MSAPVSTHKATNELGLAVVNGVVRWLSASTITQGDTQSDGGCLRRFHYRNVALEPEPSTGSQKTGTDCHEEVETTIKTGVDHLGRITSAGRQYIPPSGPGLLVEHPLYMLRAPVEVVRAHPQPLGLIDSPLWAAGAPVVGHIDLINTRGINYGASDFGDTHDPEGTVEVLDWKTTSDLVYMKTQEALSRTVQMVTYGEWVRRGFKGVRHIRLSHVYFRTRGAAAARKVSLRVIPEDNARAWEYVEGVARSLVDVARVPRDRSDQVDANTRACGAYNGCPHRRYCKAGSFNALARVFGEDGARQIAEEESMSGLIGALMPAAAPAVAPVAPPAGVGVAIGLAPQIAAEAQRLEAQLAATPAPQPAAAPLSNPPPPAGGGLSLAEAWKGIVAAGRGTPAVSGNAGAAVAVACGVQYNGAGYAGSGELAPLALVEPAQVIQLATELGVKPPAPPAPMMPAPQPAPAPVMAPQPSYVLAAPPQPAGLLSPSAPASNPQLAALPVQPTAGEVANGAAPVATPDKPKKARAKRKPPTDGPSDGGFTLYVDCTPDGDHERLEGYVDAILEHACKEGNLPDVRLGDQHHPFGFGRWKGVIAVIAQRQPPPGGVFVVDARGNEIAEVIVAALRTHEKCDAFVRGR